MAYTATAGGFPPSVTSAPRVLALQRALVWLVGASGAIVFIEPSPYELTTLAAAVIFFATGLRLRLVFMPLLGAGFVALQADERALTAVNRQQEQAHRKEFTGQSRHLAPSQSPSNGQYIAHPSFPMNQVQTTLLIGDALISGDRRTTRRRAVSYRAYVPV